MNVMKNWGCLNKIKLVGILLAGGLHFIFFLPSIPPLPLILHFFSLFFVHGKKCFICSITLYLATDF